jgi:hypothetical protein
MPISTTRWFFPFIVSFLLTSNLNWAIAGLWLNPWAMPAFDGFMRQGDNGATVANILKMSLGFMLPILAMSIILPLMKSPRS